MNNAPELLPCVEIEPGVPATRSVIWLHGLGANGHDFEPIVPMLRPGPDLPARFVLPHAPNIPVTLNAGMVMPAWFDIWPMSDGTFDYDQDGVERSAEQIRELVRREIERGVEPQHIVIAGFSQGGAIALYMGLQHDPAFAGVLALSTALAHTDALKDVGSAPAKNTPILMAHGTHDPMIQITRGQHTRDQLAELGYQVEWKDYPMQHEVCPQEIADIAAWLRRVLA